MTHPSISLKINVKFLRPDILVYPIQLLPSFTLILGAIELVILIGSIINVWIHMKDLLAHSKTGWHLCGQYGGGGYSSSSGGSLTHQPLMALRKRFLIR